MISDELIEFIESSLAEGQLRADIEDVLITQGGWSKEEVELAFQSIVVDASEETSVEATPAAGTSSRRSAETKLLLFFAISLLSFVVGFMLMRPLFPQGAPDESEAVNSESGLLE